MRWSPNLLVALGLFLLAITNPSAADYSSWARQQIAAASKGDPLVSLVAYAVGDPVLQAATRRQSFIVFSIFSTNLDGAHEVKTLGIAGNFFPMEQPKAPWRPGGTNPGFPHVIAGSAPDTWKPEDGYVWVRQPPNGDFRVQWQPGRSSENFPHLVAAAAEERWFPEDGYTWNIDPPPVGQLGVHWVPGKQSTKFAHVVSASADGRWFPDDGYAWNVNPPPAGQLGVHLVSGNSSKRRPHLVSALTEGRWLPDSGYRWVVDPPGPGDFRIEPLPPAASANEAAAEHGAAGGNEVPRKKQQPEAAFDSNADHGQRQYALDLACSEANPPCPRWWVYARRVSQQLGLPLCPLDFQRDLGAKRFFYARSLPLTQPCVVPGALTSTGPLRCDHGGCCKPGISC